MYLILFYRDVRKFAINVCLMSTSFDENYSECHDNLIISISKLHLRQSYVRKTVIQKWEKLEHPMFEELSSRVVEVRSFVRIYGFS